VINIAAFTSIVNYNYQMVFYSLETKQNIRRLRRQGCSYPEIQAVIEQHIPKGTMSYICKDVIISKKGRLRIDALIKANRDKARLIAISNNRRNFENKLQGYRKKHLGIGRYMRSRRAQLIALAVLYLGEGAKWKGSRGLQLGSSDPLIIKLYINL
jgi:hypothetical protein